METQWVCTHCERIFQTPIADHLGQHLCKHHPAAHDTRTYPCCNNAQLESKGCTPCDHLPQAIFNLSFGGRVLVVPAYILSPLRSATRLVLDKDKRAEAMGIWLSPIYKELRLAIIARARLESHYWETLPPAFLQGAQTRVQKRVLLLEAQQQQATYRQITWMPYVPPPEAPTPTVQKGAAEQQALATMVAMLVNPRADALVCRAAPRGLVNTEMAGELRTTPMNWAVVCISN